MNVPYNGSRIADITLNVCAQYVGKIAKKVLWLWSIITRMWLLYVCVRGYTEWADIAFHFLLDSKGYIYEARNPRAFPAAVLGYVICKCVVELS